jgi:hypothetical protein
MANLSAYIDFSAVLQKDTNSSALILSDPDDYPVGVDVNLKGYFVITQPDGITITGNYLSPDIYYVGPGLSTASKQLRLRSNGSFQQGEYTITYNIVAPGYDETTLTKTFDLSYTSPTIVVEDDFDVFTPTLSVTDDTDYVVAGMDFTSVTRAWEATIISVEGVNQDISATGQSFDLGYLGAYYDSRYDVTLTATAFYTLSSPDDWVSIEDTVIYEHTYYAFIPPTLIELLDMLTAYKATVDAANCICGPGCADNCTPLKNTYALAVSIYTHIVERGRQGITTGLDAYVLQLQKLLSNCVTPAYTNTNEAIPPYDWGSSNTGGAFVFFKQMIVGSGVNDAPADGATSYTDALLVGKSVQVFLDSLLMGIGLADRISITYNSGTGTITWNTALVDSQLISIYSF